MGTAMSTSLGDGYGDEYIAPAMSTSLVGDEYGDEYIASAMGTAMSTSLIAYRLSLIGQTGRPPCSPGE